MATPRTDVVVPMARRRQLVNKLFQQYQAGRSGGRTSGGGTSEGVRQMVGRLFQQYQAAASGGGTPFRSVTQMPHYPITQMTGNNNVVASIRAQLGPGGYGTPLAGEMSAGPGQPLPLPLPRPLPTPPDVPLPTPDAAPVLPPVPSLAPAPVDPTPVDPTLAPVDPTLTSDRTALSVSNPTTVDKTSLSAGTIDPTLSDRTSLSADTVASLPEADTWHASTTFLAPDAVPLGGGTYYSPTTGYTTPVYVPKLGGAVGGLGHAVAS